MKEVNKLCSACDAREAIYQLENEIFLCHEGLISTSGYVIVKKTDSITVDMIKEAIRGIKKQYLISDKKGENK